MQLLPARCTCFLPLPSAICLLPSASRRLLLLEPVPGIRYSSVVDIDLKQFALGVLEIARENLVRDGQLVAIAFIVSPAGIEARAVDPFESPEEKRTVYRRIVAEAHAVNALAIVTLNDAYYHLQPTPEWLENYSQGKLADEKYPECITITASGPGIQTWTIRLPYSRTQGRFEFGEVEETSGGQFGLLEGWASDSVMPS